MTFAIRSLTTFADFLRTVDHLCKDMEELMATELTVSAGKEYIVRELLMNQFRFYTDASYKICVEKVMASNKKGMYHLLNLRNGEV